MKQESEVWKPINGFVNYYISNLGRVKAGETKTRFGIQFKTYPERYIKAWLSRTGYNYIDISIKGKRSRFLLHRIVALHFVDNPLNKPQINHLDGDKNNNCYFNLEWCTANENLKHAIDSGLNNSIGINNKMAKLTGNNVKKIRLSDRLLRELAIEFEVSQCTISKIKSFKTYKNV